jgi:predicted AlkP superfamily pyrophosphatase or phosphodiesterase
MMLMSEVRRRFTKVLKIRMKVEDFNEDLLALIKQNYADNGDCELELLLVTEYGDLKLDTDGKSAVLLTDDLIDQLLAYSEEQLLEYRVVCT